MTASLVSLAISEWATLDGFAASRNMPELEEMPLDRFANFVWWFFTRNAEPKEIEKFKTKLWIPPKGAEIPKESPWSADSERSSFSALKAQLGLGA